MISGEEKSLFTVNNKSIDKNISDNLILQYIQENKRLFTVNNINTIRDGGTVILESYTQDRQKFYVDKNNKTLHSEYPTTNENKVIDRPTIAFIFKRLEEYLEKQESQIQRDKNIINKIIENNSFN